MSKDYTRRAFVTAAAGAITTMTVAKGAFAKTIPQPHRSKGYGGDEKGAQSATLEEYYSNTLNPPATDHGSLPNLVWPFSASHMRQETGGWTRQTTKEQLPVSTTIAGVQMRLNKGGVRALHWHKEAEWGFVEYGKVRVTMLDNKGRYFIKDLEKGDIWLFPAGFPHSIQGLDPKGTQFLLAFDDGGFDENDTFLINDWFNHVPPEILAQNFGTDTSFFKDAKIPSSGDRYIFDADTPNENIDDMKIDGKKTEDDYTFSLGSSDPIFENDSGSVRVADKNNFKINKYVAAALVEVKPGALRELHWHPNQDEWNYFLSGKGKMGVFAASGNAWTFDVGEGMVGYVPHAMGHYIKNESDETMRFLELFKAPNFEDISLNKWMAETPRQLVEQHLGLGEDFLKDHVKSKDQIVTGVNWSKKRADKDKKDKE